MFSTRLLTVRQRWLQTITMSSSSDSVVQYLKLKDGKTLAYEKLQSRKSNSRTVIYIYGFLASSKSGKEASKVSFLRQLCLENDYTFIRYDPTSLGDSTGTKRSVEMKDWVEDAGAVLENLGSEHNVIVGSSMGGWIGLWLASQPQFSRKISGLLLVAPAVNFFRPHYKLTYRQLPAQHQQSLDRGEVVNIEWDKDQDLGLRKSFVEKSLQYELNFRQGINVTCPVTILHGVEDDSVPYQKSIRIMNKLKTEEVELVYSKSADHQFSDNKSLQILSTAFKKMMKMC